MTFWAHVFLGIIAAATLVMALIQLGALMYGWRLARQVTNLVVRIEEEIKPLAASLRRRDARGRRRGDAGRARVDGLFADHHTICRPPGGQRVVAAPVREEPPDEGVGSAGSVVGMATPADTGQHTGGRGRAVHRVGSLRRLT